MNLHGLIALNIQELRGARGVNQGELAMLANAKRWHTSELANAK